MVRRRSRPEDLDSIKQIWKEIGWVDDDAEAEHIEAFLADADVLVAETHGEVSCSVSGHRSKVRYDTIDVPTWHISSVTTGFTGRKQGHAQALTAQSLRLGAENGMGLAILGMFEQGFYNRLGFGCGYYDLLARIDPGMLRVDHPVRPPLRLGAADIAAVVASIKARKRTHGGFVPDSDAWLSAEFMWGHSLALGYRDADGRITHCLIGSTKGESGPHRVNFMAYETTDQLLELLALIGTLGDQVRSLFVVEPSEIQIQDLLHMPIRHKIVTAKTDHEVSIKASAWWQVRMLDVGACVAARVWDGEPVRFTLELSDPLADLLDDGGADGEGASWRGVAGAYVVEIGSTSSAVSGSDDDLPTLRASVGAFTRLWIGARPASSLALTDDLDGPPALISALDRAFLMPVPRPGMPM